MPAFIVHTLSQTVAALTAAAEAGCTVTLASPPGAVHSLGTGYFLAMVAAARATVPAARSRALLDCGAAPGLALAALRAGVEAVRVEAAPEVLAKLAEIANRSGAKLVDHWPERILDLGATTNPIAEARTFLLAFSR